MVLKCLLEDLECFIDCSTVSYSTGGHIDYSSNFFLSKVLDLMLLLLLLFFFLFLLFFELAAEACLP